jgi:hypothetical protein
MIDIRPLSSSKTKQKKTEITPNIHQLADLTQNEPILGMNKNFISKFSPIDNLKINYRTNHNRVGWYDKIAIVFG